MTKYYEAYRNLIVISAFSGLYFQPVEKIITRKWITTILKYYALLPLSCLPLYVMFQLKYFFFDEAGVLSKLFSLLLLAFSFTSACIIVSFHNSRSDYVQLFEAWDIMFPENLYSEDREELLVKKRKITNRWLNIFFPFSVLASSTYSFINYLHTNKDLGHPSGIPYRHQSPDFELVATFEFIITFFEFVTLIIYDSMTMVFLSLVETELLHLKQSLGRILDSISVSYNGEVNYKSNEEFFAEKHLGMPYSWYEHKIFVENENQIRIWLLHHQRILGFQKELQRLYGASISLKFIAFMFALCLSSFLTITEGFSPNDSFAAVCYCINSYSLLYINIKFSDSIIELGETLFDEAFGKSWNYYPKHLKIAFQIIQLRTHKPIQIMALKVFPLSSPSFLKILSSAYSFFTFLFRIAKV